MNSLFLALNILRMGFLQNKKILIVEDEYSNYYLLKKIIESQDGDSIWVTNGEEAINQIDDDQDIDLVLMDLKLPLMSGTDATRVIKKKNSSTPIIAVTAYAMKSDEKAAMNAGCDAYIVKPLKKDELLKKIGEFI